MFKTTAHMHTILIATYYPTVSTLVIVYEHIITHNKITTNKYKVNCFLLPLYLYCIVLMIHVLHYTVYIICLRIILILHFTVYIICFLLVLYFVGTFCQHVQTQVLL